jgi:hypothetical protein
MKVPAIIGTVMGGALGAAAVGLGIATLPIALPVGLGAGIVVDLLRRNHHVALTVTPPPPPQVAATLAQYAPTAVQASAKAASAPPAQATALHQYLVKHPASRVGLSKDPAADMLVRMFQAAFNADAHAVAAFGNKKLPTNGAFGNATAAALMFYTHDPIPPDPMAVLTGPATTGGGPEVSVSLSVGT